MSIAVEVLETEALNLSVAERSRLVIYSLHPEAEADLREATKAGTWPKAARQPARDSVFRSLE